MKKLLILICCSFLLTGGCASIKKAFKEARMPKVENLPQSEEKISVKETKTEAKIPYETEEIPSQETKGMRVEETVIPKKASVEYDETILPPGNYPDLKLTPRFTVAQVEDKIRKTGLKPYQHPEPLLITTQGKNKWHSGWIPAYTLLLGKSVFDVKTGTETFTPSLIGRCGNPSKGVQIKLTPAKETRIEREKTSVKVVERYRDNIIVEKTVEKKYPPPKPCPSVTFTPEERAKMPDYPGGGGGGAGGSGGGGCGGGSGASR